MVYTEYSGIYALIGIVFMVALAGVIVFARELFRLDHTCRHKGFKIYNYERRMWVCKACLKKYDTTAKE